MTVTNLARFKINDTPSEDVDGKRGYDAEAGETLTLTLERNPALGVSTVTYSLHDASDSTSPLNSLYASNLAFADRSKSVTTSAVNSSFDVEIPEDSDISSYIFRASVVTATGQEVFERMVCIRHEGYRMTVPAETNQYSQRGWSDALNEAIKLIFGAVAFLVNNAAVSFLDTARGIAYKITGNRVSIATAVANVAALRADASLITAGSIRLDCHTSNGDGGGGDIYWDELSEEDDDEGTCFAVVGVDIGRWIRLDRDTAIYVDAHWWGIHKTDDTIAFTRALAFSIGASYAAWMAGGGDNADLGGWSPTHRSRPVSYSGTVTLKSTINVRYRNVQICGPTQYGDGMSPGSDRISVGHNGHAIVLDTGDVTTYYCPSLNLSDVVLIRTNAYRLTCLDGICISGPNWFNGLSCERTIIGANRSGISTSADHKGPTISSGLRLWRTNCAGNREFGIDTGVNMMWDLSEVRNCGLNANTLGPCRMAIVGGTIERVDIEGGGNGGIIWAYNARVGHFYVEATGPDDVPAIMIRAFAGTEVIASTNADGRPAVYFIEYSDNSRITDESPVRVHGSCNIDIVNGLSPTKFATDFMCCVANSSSAPYLRRMSALVDADSVRVVAPVAQYTSVAQFSGEPLIGAPIGSVVAEDGILSVTESGPFVAGHTYLVAFSVTYDSNENLPAHYGAACAVIGVDRLDVPVQFFRADLGWQAVAMWTPVATVSTQEFQVFPYGETYEGHGAVVSPLVVAEVTDLTVVPQFHVPTLLSSLSRSRVVPDAYISPPTSIPLVLNTLTETTKLTFAGCNLNPTSNYLATVECRSSVWESVDPENSGSIDLTVDVLIVTDISSIATCAVVGSQYPDVSRVPTGWIDAYASVVPITDGVGIHVKGPTGITCSAKTRVCIGKVEELL